VCDGGSGTDKAKGCETERNIPRVLPRFSL
jgi:hypothetical protein